MIVLFVLLLLADTPVQPKACVSPLDMLKAKGAVFFVDEDKRTLIISRDGWEGRTAAWSGDKNDLTLIPLVGKITRLLFEVDNRTLASPDCLDFLPKIQGLQRLDITLNKETSNEAKTIEWISKCSELEILTIFGGGFDDDAIAPLAKMKLRELSFGSPNLTEKSIATFESLKSLENLFVAGANYGDGELLRFAKHNPNLKRLTLPTSARITPMGIERFKSLVPGCTLQLKYSK